LFIIRRSLHFLCLLLEIGAPKPEKRDSILDDPDPSKPLMGTQKLILISQVNPFEFFFDGRK
jgi:hypothetical protein